MLISALIPLIRGLAQKSTYSKCTPPVTPKHTKTTSAIADSPIPEKGSEQYLTLPGLIHMESMEWGVD